MKKLEQINMKAKSFVVFNNILEDDVMKAFLNMIDIKEKSDTLYDIGTFYEYFS